MCEHITRSGAPNSSIPGLRTGTKPRLSNRLAPEVFIAGRHEQTQGALKVIWARRGTRSSFELAGLDERPLGRSPSYLGVMRYETGRAFSPQWASAPTDLRAPRPGRTGALSFSVPMVMFRQTPLLGTEL